MEIFYVHRKPTIVVEGVTMGIVDSSVNTGTQGNKTPITARGREEEKKIIKRKPFMANVQCLGLGRVGSYTAEAFSAVLAPW